MRPLNLALPPVQTVSQKHDGALKDVHVAPSTLKASMREGGGRFLTNHNPKHR